MTAVGWDEWDDDEPAPDPTPAVPAYYCEGPCCWVPPRPPGLLKRLLAALRPAPPGGQR
ncbi:hypothetical protein [Streptomyces sp. AK08-02]|uniref:hypothetical protein n=1 Tax=Streptomyces sp. AK08-02 TaxID=3028654 RepID=UPI0029B98F08|nr:hypothetical protein [Streptomyces sp. AK08-02]MDX3748709.1 hypothetical protein [Streptomyces sp. AK08-02]